EVIDVDSNFKIRNAGPVYQNITIIGSQEYYEKTIEHLKSIQATDTGKELLDVMNKAGITISQHLTSEPIREDENGASYYSNFTDVKTRNIFFDPFNNDSSTHGDESHNNPWLKHDPSITLYHEMTHIYYSILAEFDNSISEEEKTEMMEHMVSGIDYASSDGVILEFSNEEFFSSISENKYREEYYESKNKPIIYRDEANGEYESNEAHYHHVSTQYKNTENDPSRKKSQPKQIKNKAIIEFRKFKADIKNFTDKINHHIQEKNDSHKTDRILNKNLATMEKYAKAFPKGSDERMFFEECISWLKDTINKLNISNYDIKEYGTQFENFKETILFPTQSEKISKENLRAILQELSIKLDDARLSLLEFSGSKNDDLEKQRQLINRAQIYLALYDDVECVISLFREPSAQIDADGKIESDNNGNNPAAPIFDYNTPLLAKLDKAYNENNYARARAVINEERLLTRQKIDSGGLSKHEQDVLKEHKKILDMAEENLKRSGPIVDVRVLFSSADSRDTVMKARSHEGFSARVKSGQSIIYKDPRFKSYSWPLTSNEQRFIFNSPIVSIEELMNHIYTYRISNKKDLENDKYDAEWDASIAFDKHTSSDDENLLIRSHNFIEDLKIQGKVSDFGPLHILIKKIRQIKDRTVEPFKLQILANAEALLVADIEDVAQYHIQNSPEFKDCRLPLLATERFYIRANPDKEITELLSHILQYRQGKLNSLHSKEREAELEEKHLAGLKDQPASGGLSYTKEQQLEAIKQHGGLFRMERLYIDNHVMLSKKSEIQHDEINRNYWADHGITDPENVYLVYQYSALADPYPRIDRNAPRQKQIETLNQIRRLAPGHYSRIISQKMGSRYLFAVDEEGLERVNWSKDEYAKTLQTRADYALGNMKGEDQAYAIETLKAAQVEFDAGQPKGQQRQFFLQPRIYGYPLDNMLLIKDGDKYTMISLMPPGQAYVFKTKGELNKFLLDKNNHEFILSHVSRYYQMDGVSYSGVEKTLNALRNNEWKDSDTYLLPFAGPSDRLCPKNIMEQVASSTTGDDENIGHTDNRVNLLNATQQNYYAGDRGNNAVRTVETTGNYKLPKEYNNLNEQDKYKKLYEIEKGIDLQSIALGKIKTFENDNFNTYKNSLEYSFNQLILDAIQNGKLSPEAKILIEKARVGDAKIAIPSLGENLRLGPLEANTVPLEGMILINQGDKFILVSLNGNGTVLEFSNKTEYEDFFCNPENHDFIIKHMSEYHQQLDMDILLERMTFWSNQNRNTTYPVSTRTLEREEKYEKAKKKQSQLSNYFSSSAGFNAELAPPDPAHALKTAEDLAPSTMFETIGRRNLQRLRNDADTLLKSNAEWHTEKFFEVSQYVLSSVSILLSGGAAAAPAGSALAAGFTVGAAATNFTAATISVGEGIYQTSYGDTREDRQGGLISLILIPLDVIDVTDSFGDASKAVKMAKGGRRMRGNLPSSLARQLPEETTSTAVDLGSVSRRQEVSTTAKLFQSGSNTKRGRIIDGVFQIFSVDASSWRQGNALEQAEFMLENGGPRKMGWGSAPPPLGANRNPNIPGTTGRPLYGQGVPVRRPKLKDEQWEGVEGTLPGTDEDYLAFIRAGGDPEEYSATLKEAEPNITGKPFQFFNQKLQARVNNGKFEVAPAGEQTWRAGHWWEEIVWRFKYRGGPVENVTELDERIIRAHQKNNQFNQICYMSAINTAECGGELSRGAAASLRDVSRKGINSPAYRAAFGLDSPPSDTLKSADIKQSGFIHIGTKNSDGTFTYNHVVYAHVIDGSVFLYQSNSATFQKAMGLQTQVGETSLSRTSWSPETDNGLSLHNSKNSNTIYQFTPTNEVKIAANLSIENGEMVVDVGGDIEIFAVRNNDEVFGRIPFDHGQRVVVRGYTANFKGIDGQEAISIHGDKAGNFYLTSNSQKLSAKELVQYLKNEGVDLTTGKGPIHLLSCYAKSSGAAQALADETGRPVIAYSNRTVRLPALHLLEDSSAWIGSKMRPSDPRRFLAQTDFKPATPKTFLPKKKTDNLEKGRNSSGSDQRQKSCQPESGIKEVDHTRQTAPEQLRVIDSKPEENLFDTYRETILENDRIFKLIQNPREACEAMMGPVGEYMKENGFTNIQYRAMNMWVNAGDDVPSTHFVVVGTKDGKQYVFDLTAAQFQDRGMPTLDEPLILPEASWAKRYQSASKRKLIKYKDFDNISDARIAFGSTQRPLPTEIIEGGTLLTEPGWYKTMKNNQADTRLDTEEMGALAREGILSYESPVDYREKSSLSSDDLGSTASKGFVPYVKPSGKKYIYFPFMNDERVNKRLIPLLRDLSEKGAEPVEVVFRNQEQAEEFVHILIATYGPPNASSLEPKFHYLYNAGKTNLEDLKPTDTLYVSGHGQPGDGNIYSEADRASANKMNADSVADDLNGMLLPDDVPVKVATCNSAVGNSQEITLPSSKADHGEQYAHATDSNNMGTFDNSLSGRLENALLERQENRKPGLVYGYLGYITNRRTRTIMGRIMNGELKVDTFTHASAALSDSSGQLVDFRRSDMMRGRFYDPNPMHGRHGVQDLQSDMPSVDERKLRASASDKEPKVEICASNTLIQAQGAAPSKKLCVGAYDRSSQTSIREAKLAVWENSAKNVGSSTSDVLLIPSGKFLRVKTIVSNMKVGGSLNKYDEISWYTGNPACFIRIVRVASENQAEENFEITVEKLEEVKPPISPDKLTG
ncbi:MAG: hypothetical protein K2Q15_12350, partial [Burkholderiales bacterium]|nr:hypothetical protein [Burkholderiales bacterium]